MPIKTKRWDEPAEPDDGFRLLICRYRPRALPKAAETWDAWDADLGPSPALLKAFQGKTGYAIQWTQYRRRYIKEQEANHRKIAALAARVQAGETITLLCSASCADPDRCHRTLLEELINDSLSAQGAKGPDK